MRKGWVYQDDKLRKKVLIGLEEYGYYLIYGDPGRGKSMLCNVIGHSTFFRTKGTDEVSSFQEVYFIDCNSVPPTFIPSFREQLDILLEKKIKDFKYLFIIENIHVLEDGGKELMDIIPLCTRVKEKEDRIFYFLLTTREQKIVEEISGFSEEKNCVKLSPDAAYLEGVLSSLRKVLLSTRGSEMDSDSISCGVDNVNLRLWSLSQFLGSYPPNWDNMEESICSIIVEQYGGGKRNRLRGSDDALLYLSSLYQFDIPICVPCSQKAINRYGYEFSVREVLDSLGSVVLKSGNHFFCLPHSLDAQYLFRGLIQKKNPELRSQEENRRKEEMDIVSQSLVDYTDALLQMNDARKFEDSFVSLLVSIGKREDCRSLWTNLLSSKKRPEDIILRLNPGFLILFLTASENGESMYSVTKEEKLLVYKNTIKSIRKYIQERHVLFIRLAKAFKNYYPDETFIKDVFSNDSEEISVEEFANFLNKCDCSIPSRVRIDIEEQLGEPYLEMLQTWIIQRKSKVEEERIRLANLSKERQQKIKKSVIFYDSNEKYDPRSVAIYDRFIMKLCSEAKVAISNHQNLERTRLWWGLVERGAEFGFFCRGLSWQSLGSLMHYLNILREQKQHDDARIDKVLNKMLNMVRDQIGSLDRATPEEFSLLLTVLMRTSKEFYDSVIQMPQVRVGIKNRLQKEFAYSGSDLYLLSHFYNNSQEIRTYVYEAGILTHKPSSKQRQLMQGWARRVKEKIEEIQEGTLVWAIMDQGSCKPIEV